MRGVVCVLLTAVLTAPGPAWAADDPAASRSHCFSSDQFQGWRAQNARTIYIRANANRYYRLDLARECPDIVRTQAQLTLDVPGGGLICSAADFTLKASRGFPDVLGPCFVKAMTELSAAEVADLPPKLKP